MRERLIIGWKEIISLPEWGIGGITAKSDTGARSCAIDVSNIQELEDGRISFEVILARGSEARTRPVTAEVVGKTVVRSSNGRSQLRYRVRTQVKIGECLKAADFTLVNRRRMIHRVLLGRHFLAHDFLVDPSQVYVHGGRPTRRSATIRKA
ncbi:MAG: RimK/LysX family protein [Verrucomicrobiota bacterium JB022]|nr:RimK/LysX family protein [Verrucomicrobiota bacterium JB022]